MKILGKPVIAAVLALACSFSLHGEIYTRIERSPEGQSGIVIRNNYATTLQAYVVSAVLDRRDRGGGMVPLLFYSDQITNPATKPLQPNEERVVMEMPDSTGNFVEPTVTAGIFDNGSTIGDPGLLTRLLLRRSNMLLAVENIEDALANSRTRNVPSDQLIEELKKMMRSLNRGYLVPEQRIGLSLYQSIIDKLMNLPEPKEGSPLPLVRFVLQETPLLSKQSAALRGSKPDLFSAAQGAALNSK